MPTKTLQIFKGFSQISLSSAFQSLVFLEKMPPNFKSINQTITIKEEKKAATAGRCSSRDYYPYSISSAILNLSTVNLYPWIYQLHCLKHPPALPAGPRQSPSLFLPLYGMVYPPSLLQTNWYEKYLQIPYCKSIVHTPGWTTHTSSSVHATPSWTGPLPNLSSHFLQFNWSRCNAMGHPSPTPVIPPAGIFPALTYTGLSVIAMVLTLLQLKISKLFISFISKPTSPTPVPFTGYYNCIPCNLHPLLPGSPSPCMV